MKTGWISKFKDKKDDSSNLVMIISLINILLAVVALTKDILLASYLGTTNKSDAFTLTFFITDTIGNNLIASAAAMSCIPFFTKVKLSKGIKGLYKSVIRINIVFSLITFFTALILFLFRNGIIDILAHGFSAGTKALCIKLLMILLPTVILYTLASTGISYMQVRGRFITSSLVPVVYNFVFLLGIVYCFVSKTPVNKGVYIICVSILLAVIAMVVFSCSNVSREEAELEKHGEDEERTNSVIYKLFIPYSIILFISQSVMYYERYLASKFPAGTVAALSYTYRLSQFPIWVFAAAIGTVAFPMMSRHSGNQRELNKVFKRALWWIIVLTLPIIIMIYILRIPIVTVLFLRGAFNGNSLRITVEILSGYVFSILGQGIMVIGVRFFLAKEEMKNPIIIYIISSTINIILDSYLVGKIGIAGLGYGAAISSVINAGLMIYVSKIDMMTLKRHVDKPIKLVAANLFVILICYFGNVIWNLFIFKYIFMVKFLYIGIVAIVTLIFYAAGLKLLKLF